MDSRPCQHEGCGRESHTGFWCQECIEHEWPYAAWGDGKHWIVWKGVSAARGYFDTFTGALSCPYRLGRVVTLHGTGNWLLSPLGAIKEEHGTHILAALVGAQWCWLSPRLIIYSGSPALPLGAFPRSQLPSPEQVRDWLSDVNGHLEVIEAFETLMRAQMQPPIAAMSDQLADLESKEKRFEADKVIELHQELSGMDYLAARLHEVLAQLNEREQEILSLRYGLKSGHPRALMDVAVVFNTTRERVRQIEQKAFEKLRHPGRKG